MKKEDIVSLKQEMEINELNLYDEVLKQPSLFLNWAIRSARANRKVLDARFRLKVVSAEESKKIREEYFRDNGKTLAATASLDKEFLPLREEYKNAYQDLINLEEESDILDAAKEAARQRKDMIQTYALNLRAELKSEILIRDKDE